MLAGLVCDSCDALSELRATECVSCGTSLGVVAKSASAARRCKTCNAEIPERHRFCGVCGQSADEPSPIPEKTQTAVSAPKAGSKTQFFGAMQAPGRAKLILIKGEGMDGVSYVLSAVEHSAGRRDGAILFPDDPLLSPRHANFFYANGKLFVRDEHSQNGVFVRTTKPLLLPFGSTFLVGEQLVRVDETRLSTGPICGPDGTYFYGSPRKPSKMQLTQLLVGGQAGMVYRAASDSITIGREGNDVNFPEDPFISGRHATVAIADAPGQFLLTDLGSKNGTFRRISGESALVHGDYVFLGQQLLRVEIM